ncbi:DUF4184 family protein [Streptomyces sp. 12297]
MPFTLAHPAAVLPLFRRPLIPAALVAGAMAPDIPYFLGALGLTATSRTWYEPLTNAGVSHSATGALTVSLLFALCLLALHLLVRAPVTDLLPARWVRPAESPRQARGLREHVGKTPWLLLSALIGTATHLAWDAVTLDGFLAGRLTLLHGRAVGAMTLGQVLEYASSAVGLAIVGRFLWRHRAEPHSRHDRVAHLTPTMRWSVLAALALACVLGAAANLQGVDAYRQTTTYDYSRPITHKLADGVTTTGYPTRTVETSWADTAEALLYDTAKGAGAALILSLLAYGTTWHTTRLPKRFTRKTAPSSHRV